MHRSPRLLACSLGCLFAAAAVAAEPSTTVTEPFQGVRHIHRTQTEPRELSIHILEIDLTAPGIAFRLTPPNGDTVPGETTAQTTRDYLIEEHAQIAINTSYFAFEPRFPYTDNIGLAVSDGVRYSPFQSVNRHAINISEDNVATIVRSVKQDLPGYSTTPHADLYNAISGDERIVRAGRNVADNQTLHPRTAIGVTDDHKLLILVADGRNPSHSLGMKTTEVADLMIEYGAIDAINLDGGGSTTLVFADPSPRLVNIPVGVSNEPGSERRTGANLAIFARPTDSRHR